MTLTPGGKRSASEALNPSKTMPFTFPESRRSNKLFRENIRGESTAEIDTNAIIRLTLNTKVHHLLDQSITRWTAQPVPDHLVCLKLFFNRKKCHSFLPGWIMPVLFKDEYFPLNLSTSVHCQSCQRGVGGTQVLLVLVQFERCYKRKVIISSMLSF